VSTIEDLSALAPPAASDGVSNILNMLRRRRYIIIGFVTLCTVLTVFVTMHLKPLYRVDLNILIDPHNIQLNDVQTLATENRFYDAGVVRNQMAILWDEELVRDVVTSLDLQDNADFDPAASRYFTPLSPDSLLDRPLIAFRDLLTRLFQSVRSAPASPTPTPAAKIDAAITRYLGNISVLNDGHSYIVTLRVTACDPELAVKIAKAHARAYIAHQLASKTASVREANASVSAELDALAAKLKASEEALRAFRANSAMIGPDSPAVISQQINDIAAKRIALGSQIIDKQTRLRALRALLDDAGSGDASSLATSASYDRLRGKEQDLMQQQAELRATFGDSYPKLTEIRLQIDATRAQLRAEVERMVNSAAGDLAAARSQEEQLDTQMQAAKTGVEHQEGAAPSLHFLEAEVEANKTVYTAFLTRVRQLSAQEALQQPDGRVVGDAIPPTRPFFPNPPLLISGGFIGSLAVAVALALVLGFASRGYNSLAQVERDCDAPGLGVIPLIKRRDRRTGSQAQLSSLSNPHYAERVRLVRNSLALAINQQNRGRVTLLTSSLPMEGKTSCAVSLALSVAAGGRKVLLIDADLRRPGVAGILGSTPDQPGFGDLIEGKATIEDVIQVHERSGLHFIATHSTSIAAQDRINFDQTAALLETLRGRYDFIFVDSSPLIAVSDALWLAHAADATLFLVRWQRTPRSAVRAAVQKLRDTGTTITGVLLTFVDIEKSGSLTPSDFDYYRKQVRRYYG
jgi:polysaccharide biosynthesis transport protein